MDAKLTRQAEELAKAVASQATTRSIYPSCLARRCIDRYLRFRRRLLKAEEAMLD